MNPPSVNKVSAVTDSDCVCKKEHLRFLKHFLYSCPHAVASQDTNRVTLAFFVLCGIDLLNGLDTIKHEYRIEITEWLYHLQVLPTLSLNNCDILCGFQGGSTNILKNRDKSTESAHLANTYTALASLLILGDDLSRLDRRAILESVARAQQPDGSFCAALHEESDMRFVYCAACICYILNDFSTIDLNKMVKFVVDSIGYEGALGQGPGMEVHGGSTFCGVAALALSSSLDKLTSIQLERIKRWCILRQGEGFNGRPNKPEDSCYSFWVGGTLALLDSYSWVDVESNRNFLLSTQDSIGGFSKYPDFEPDPHHTFFAIAGLSLLGETGIAPIEPRLTITKRAHNFLMELHQRWQK